MRIVCISDTHTLHHEMTHEVPDGDILLHAGDIMNSGWDKEDIYNFCAWYSKLSHPYKIFIAGNHDRYTENQPEQTKIILENFPNLIYLENSGVEVEGLKIYGSPVQPWFHDWAWNRRRGKEIKKYWDAIPDSTEILLSHGPPYGILDKVEYRQEHVGCEDLLNRIKELKNLKLSVFGHLHESYGMEEHNGVTFVNASICTLQYRPLNAPIVVDLDI